MAASLSIRLEQLGTPQCPAPNVQFSVQDPDSVWIVQSGGLDLFLVGTGKNRAESARYPVMRIQPGEAAFGIGHQSDDFQLVATAAPGTNLLLLSHAGLNRMAFSRDHFVSRLVEDWVNHFAGVVAGNTPPGPFLPIEAGETLTLTDEPRAIVPKQGVVWLTHRKGTSYFLADKQLPTVNGTEFFPVSRYGWLQADAGSVIDSISSFELFTVGAPWNGLQGFHTAVTKRLIANRQKAMEKECSRLRARAVSDNALTDTALRRLASPLAGQQEFADSDEPCQDPIFLACQAVGSKLGLKVKPHPDMLRGDGPVHDPLASIAKASGIQIRRVALRDGWWTQDNGPLLAFRDKDNKPVALLPHSPRAYQILDPVTRTRVKADQTTAALLNPFAYVLYRPFPSRKLSTADLLRFGLAGCKSEALTIFWMGIAAGLMGTITPFITGIVFDTLIPGAERGQLAQMAAILVVIAIATAMFTLARSFAMLRLEGKLDASLQAASWDRLLNLPVPFFRDYSSGDLAMRGLGIAQIRQTLTGSTLTAVLSGIFSIFSFAMLFYYSWRLGLLATGLVILAFLISTACGYIQIRWHRTVLKQRGKLSSLVLQFITGIAKFRVSGTERRAFAVWAREFAQQKLIATKILRVSNILTIFNAVFPLVSLGAIFYYHSYLLSQPDIKPISTGDFLAFLAAFTQFLTAALLLSSSIVSVVGIIPLYERAQPIFQTTPEVNDAKANPGKLSGAIEINHVTFRYRPDTPLVLRDLSIRIHPGQFVAFVGASGSGKSTLLRLLLGFENPESGAIYFDGQDLVGLDLQAVRRQIGVVLQSSRPVSGDIFTNIVGSAPLTMEEAWNAARLAGMEDDIKNMPMGMHTVLSEGGGGISGGQRQRLMIARAIVTKPRMLFFDEATSALDNQTQSIVSRSMESLQATRVVIAHRLSTIMNADRIYVIDKGTLVQSGTYQELLAQKGPFAELAKRQLT